MKIKFKNKNSTFMYKNNDPKDDKIKSNNKWRTAHALLNPCTENDFILL